MINRPAPDATQSDMTSYLNKRLMRDDIESVMNELHHWSLESDYINRDKLERNSIREYYDLDYDLYFSYQINYARSGYQQNKNLSLPHKARCLICRENASSPGKENLRVFDLKVKGVKEDSDFFLQLTPFPLFPRHFVLIKREHRPMKMCAESLAQCLSFIEQAPHYTLCSNSDLEWAGASILSHSHYQLLHKRRLPVMEAAALFHFVTQEDTAERGTASDIEIEALRFPMPSIRLKSKDRDRIITEGSRIIKLWKKTAPGQRTVNMLVYREDGIFVCILILRDSRNRNPEELRKYKAEGIGVVEAAGSWIFPPPADYEEEELIQNSRDIITGFFKGIRAFDPMNSKGYDFLPYGRGDNA